MEWTASKKISSPLFPGYVFCRFDVLKRLPILITPGVISLSGARAGAASSGEPPRFPRSRRWFPPGCRWSPGLIWKLGQRFASKIDALQGALKGF